MCGGVLNGKWTVVNVHCFNDDISSVMDCSRHLPDMQISDLKDTTGQKYVHQLSPGLRHLLLEPDTKTGINHGKLFAKNQCEIHCMGRVEEQVCIKYSVTTRNCGNIATESDTFKEDKPNTVSLQDFQHSSSWT